MNLCVVGMDCALTSFRDSGNINGDNLSLEEHLAQNNFLKTRNLAIQKADKGNIVVILNKNDYISKMK